MKLTCSHCNKDMGIVEPLEIPAEVSIICVECAYQTGEGYVQEEFEFA